MFKIACDHNLHGAIVRELTRKKLELDSVRVKDVGLEEAEDPDVLEWAAAEGRIVLTHDRQTMVGFAKDRMEAGRSMPGLFVIDEKPDIGAVLRDLRDIIELTDPAEWEGLIEYLPYK